MVHLTAAASLAVVLLGTLLPFLPGAYDPLASPLSLMARGGGIVSLLLVPIGAIGLASRLSTRLGSRPRRFAVAALVVATLVWMLISLAGFLSSTALGTVTLILGLFVVWTTVRRWRSVPPNVPATAIGLYLLVLPIVIVAVQWTIVPPAVEFSRNRAIRNSERLIADIEQYRTTNGRYPLSLQALWPDYKPCVMGVEKYHYEPSGESYNVWFENPALSFGTREIVVYNPRDEQQFTSHPMDLLQYPLERLNLARGYYAVREAPHPHWKYFWFD